MIASGHLKNDSIKQYNRFELFTKEAIKLPNATTLNKTLTKLRIL